MNESKTKCPACGCAWVERPCSECDGSGKIRDHDDNRVTCNVCGGTGKDEEWLVCPNSCPDPEEAD